LTRTVQFGEQHWSVLNYADPFTLLGGKPLDGKMAIIETEEIFSEIAACQI